MWLQAWAKHGETYTEPMTAEKYSQMKKRFADVLRKSRYFKKLEKIKRQSGDFVVYELLSRPKSNGETCSSAFICITLNYVLLFTFLVPSVISYIAVFL